MYPAARSQSLSFNQIHKECSSRVKYDKRCPTCERSVSTDEIVKGYEYAKDQYVILSPEDLDKVRLESTKSISVVQFVNEGEIDPLYYHGSHYLVPDGPVAVESFATIRNVMEEKGRIALAKVVLSGKEQIVAIRPKDEGFVMSALYYADEVRSMAGLEELQDQPEVNAQEAALAGQLIDSITHEFDAERFEDEYRKQLLEIVKAKAEGKELVEPPQIETGKVINLMDALKNSLERAQPTPSAIPASESSPEEDELPATGTTRAK
jgi:DNA end-binding protein Ku